MMIENILKYLDSVIDLSQAKKVKHKISDIIAIVFFASLANANGWTEIYYFAVGQKKFLRKYLELPNGIPSHDTISRLFAMVSPEFLQSYQQQWNAMLSRNEGAKLKKILALDGKTQRGNATSNQKANHIVSAVEEKINEITAIPELLNDLNIKGQIITTDAMGTQKEIVKTIRKKRADYVLALKGNQGGLYKDVQEYFSDPELLAQSAYTQTKEKARNAIEKREYWQTSDISWLTQKKDWSGLKSIGMTKNTIIQNDKTTTQVRYFISSLPLDVKEMARAIRKHWMIESYHWHLDVTFREDVNKTIDKAAAYNLNIIKKIAINTLKLLDVGLKNVSLKAKRYMISINVEKHLEKLLAL